MKKLVFLFMFVLLSSFTFALSDADFTRAFYLEGNCEDATGNGDFTLSGTPDTVSGKNNNALNFDSTSEKCSDTSFTEVYDDGISISLWYNDTADCSASYCYIFRIFGDTPASENAFMLTAGTSVGSNELRLYDGGIAVADVTGVNIYDGVYHHIVVVHNDNGRTLVYIDNVVKKNVSTPDGFDSTNYQFYIGQRETTYDADGDIDELYVINKSLTKEEVAELYNSGNGKFYPLATGGPATDNLTITALNNYDVSINTFNTTINGTTYSTTNGTVYTDILANSSSPLYNITFQAQNYFSKEFLNVNISSGSYELTGIIQSIITFVAYEKITGTQINNFTVTDGTLSDTTTNGTATLNLLSGNNQSINITNLEGYYNITDYLNVSALQNGSGLNFTLYDKRLVVYAYDVSDGSQVNTFTVNLTGVNYSYSESLSTTNGSLAFNLTEGVWSLIIDGEGYSYDYANITLENASQFYNASLYTQNSVYITFLDQNTRQLVLENMSVDLISTSYANNYTTSTGYLNISNITSGEYEIRYKYDTSALHQTFFTKINKEHDNFTLYMLDVNDTAETKAVTLHVSEYGGLPVEDAIINILRGYIVDNQFQFLQVGSAKTNVNGETVQYFKLDVAPYKFTIEYENETVYTSATSQFITSSDEDIYFTINLFGVDYLERFTSIDDVSASLTFVNTSNTTGYFRYQFASSSNMIICLDVYRLTSASKTDLDYTCSASYGTSGILTYTINHSLGVSASYFATGTIFRQGDSAEYFYKTIAKTYSIGALNYSYIGLIFALMLNITAFFIGFKIAELKGSVMALGFAWLIIGVTRLLNTGLSISIAFIGLSIGIGLLVRGRR